MELFCQCRIERNDMNAKSFNPRIVSTFPPSLPRAAAVLFAVLWLEFGGSARATDFHWINPGGGDWSNTNNWTPSVVNPPADGDNVYITLAGTYTVNGSGSASYLQLGDGVASFPTLLLNSTGVSVSGSAYAGAGSHIILEGGDGSSLFGGGSFSANGGLALYGEIDWLAGSLGGSVTIATNGLIAGSTSLNHFFAANIYNHGRILWSANNITSDGSVLQNMPDGLLDFQNDCNFTIFGGAFSPNVVINNGTMLKSAGTNLLYFGGPYYVTNTGVVKVVIGTLELFNNVSVGGTFIVSNGAALWLESGTFTLNPGYAFTGPGFYGVPSDGNVVLYGTMTDSNFQMNGALSGTNAIAGTMNCYDGNFQGTTTVAANGVLNLNGCSSCGSIYNSTQTGGALTNAGTINWLSGDWTAEGGVFVNLSNALFRIQCDNPLGSFGGYGNWFNAGTLRKTAGIGTNNLGGFVFNNASLVDAQNGGLSFPNGLTNSGTFNAANGAAILFNSGTFYLNPGTAFTGGGFYGIPAAGNSYIYGSIPGTNFQVRGVLHGTNIVNGTMWCNGGALGDSITVASGAVLNLSYPAMFSGVITNAGRVNWLAGDWQWSASTLVNQPGGLFDIQCDGTESVLFNQPAAILNAGTMRKSAGSGTSYFQSTTAVTNTSLLDVQSGTIQIQGPYGQAGGQLNFGMAGPFQYGQLNINDPLPLTGELSANLLGGFSPAAGDTFNVLTTTGSSGVFGSLSLPALQANGVWNENYGATVTSLIVNHGRPRLGIGLTGGSFNINWSTNADSGFVLQSATNLMPPIVWQNVTNKPQTVGNQNVLALPMSNKAAYFRLQE